MMHQVKGAIEGIAYLHQGEVIFTPTVELDQRRKYRIYHGDLKPVSSKRDS
jgi:hypothetical protein